MVHPAAVPAPAPVAAAAAQTAAAIAAANSKISNITNSSDPRSINARVFVGNLNTFALTKDDVETVFKRYGRIIGISMHKGYAFIQYTSEFESRSAVAGEDQRVYAGQQVDVNMAAEPKPNRPSRKRPPGAGAEWDYFYNVPMIPGRSTLPMPLKRARPDFNSTTVPGVVSAISPGSPPEAVTSIVRPGAVVVKKRPVVAVPSGTVPRSIHAGVKALQARLLAAKASKVSTPKNGKNSLSAADETDILICGTCKQVFADLEKLAQHKRGRCRLRFACRCRHSETGGDADGEPTSFSCATCRAAFSSCWLLCVHCQTDHGINIYDSAASSTSSELMATDGTDGDCQDEGSDIGLKEDSEGDLDGNEDEGLDGGLDEDIGSIDASHEIEDLDNTDDLAIHTHSLHNDKEDDDCPDDMCDVTVQKENSQQGISSHYHNETTSLSHDVSNGTDESEQLGMVNHQTMSC